MKTADPHFLFTRRLKFRHWQATDLPYAMQLWGDGLVTRYIDIRESLTEADIQKRLDLEMATQRDHGVQYWPVFLQDGVFVGCCGLHPYGADPNIKEIGVHLCPHAWGKGLAEEAAHRVISYAFDTLSVSRLYAGHHPGQEACKHLMQKLRFTYTHDGLYEPTGLLHPSYMLDRQ